jgi:hypothetical protein
MRWETIGEGFFLFLSKKKNNNNLGWGTVEVALTHN